MVVAYIVRHGETVNNIKKLIQGWNDSPLTSKGEAQAKALGREMQDLHFSAAYAGDLRRQQRTAEIILSENKSCDPIKLKTDPRFREIGFGSFEGKDQTVLFSHIGRVLSVDHENFEDLVKGHSQMEISRQIAAMDPEGAAETGESCLNRFKDGLLAAAADVERERGKSLTRILVVTSGAVMGMLMETLDQENRFSHIMGNADVILVEIENGEIELKEHRAANRCGFCELH